MRSRGYAVDKQLVMRRRILLGCTCLVALSLCLWITAISTHCWLQATTQERIVIPDSTLPDGSKIFQGAHMGLFQACAYGVICSADGTSVIRSYYDCSTTETFLEEMKKHRARTMETSNEKKLVDCKNKPAFRNFCSTSGQNNQKQIMVAPENNKTYSRTDVSFGIISMFTIALGLVFSVYTFINPRYMFKRLASGIHFITCACVMIVIQIMLSSKEAGRKTDTWVFPQNVEPETGFSFVFACIVFSINLVASAAFLLLSRKRKSAQGPDDDFAMADEPTIIGR